MLLSVPTRRTKRHTNKIEVPNKIYVSLVSDTVVITDDPTKLDKGTDSIRVFSAIDRKGHLIKGTSRLPKGKWLRYYNEIDDQGNIIRRDGLFNDIIVIQFILSKEAIEETNLVVADFYSVDIYADIDLDDF